MVRPSRTRSLGDAVRGVEGQMTANRNFKRRVRARVARTGESYTGALRHFRPTQMGDTMPDTTRIRLAAAQVTVPETRPRNSPGISSCGP